ncbi:UDP-N-acetylmuramate--L-alanine ligase [Marivirga sp. S37H4]|uniref:UDP-N-acetylmuramate--L-alanine ligase n=1 Tax=Marivirga aurantiaca TaxID=2802615 RepID=A0A934X1W9_9BACT|nr:UDP-N-acetylmuramate--L-alanine ligase [Marivirga aurantiaca]MBK6266961.1 UDP-N-acetylmuramate--L-alanine ligase [Marivirga aurantiaca]
MNIKNIHSVYFIGIGGIGMSALARWFLHNGVHVAGYDKTPTHLIQSLNEEGVEVQFNDDIDLIPEEFKTHNEGILVVYTPAIPAYHKGLNYFRDQGYQLYKRSEVLGFITKGLYTVAVAGTHGKTTTSSMVAHILKSAAKNVAAFLGGISTNYNTNMLVNEADFEKSIVVVEADEFDRSFLTLHPNLAVVTSTDADHLDIYGELVELKKSFSLFLDKVHPKGKIFIKEGLWEGLDTSEVKATPVKYGLNSGELCAQNIRIIEGKFVFDIQSSGINISDLQLAVPGFHNVENATAAIGVALELGITSEEIKTAIASYKGVKRRFEYVYQSQDLIYIDDYAHHPGEIKAMLESVKALYPGKKISVLFQPHLYSRTRDFAEGFSESLSLADEVMLLDIYPAREEPIPGVSSEMLLEDIHSSEKYLLSNDKVLEHLKSARLEVFVTLGAGNIDKFVQPIKIVLEQQYAA